MTARFLRGDSLTQTTEDFVELLDVGLDAELCSDESYGDQWYHMDALLAEGLPWPRSAISWDAGVELGELFSTFADFAGYSVGALIIGPTAMRVERLLGAR